MTMIKKLMLGVALAGLMASIPVQSNAGVERAAGFDIPNAEGWVGVCVYDYTTKWWLPTIFKYVPTDGNEVTIAPPKDGWLCVYVWDFDLNTNSMTFYMGHYED